MPLNKTEISRTSGELKAPQNNFPQEIQEPKEPEGLEEAITKILQDSLKSIKDETDFLNKIAQIKKEEEILHENLSSAKDAKINQIEKTISELLKTTEPIDSRESLKRLNSMADQLDITLNEIDSLKPEDTDDHINKELFPKVEFEEQSADDINYLTSIKELKEELEKFGSDFDQLKANLESEIRELKQKNADLQRLLDQSSANNDRITELEDEKSLIKKNLVDSEEIMNEYKIRVDDLTTQLVANAQALEHKESQLKELRKKFEEAEKLKNEIETLQKSHSALQIKYDRLKETLQVKIEEISERTNKIQRIQQQLNLEKKEVENLSQKITASENNTQSLEKQLEELKLQENPMPIQHSPIDETIYADSSLNNQTKSPDEVSPTHSHSSLHASTNSSTAQTPNSSTDAPLNIFFPNADSSRGENSGFVDLTSSSSSNLSSLESSDGNLDRTDAKASNRFKEESEYTDGVDQSLFINPLGASNPSSSSGMNRSQSLPDLGTKFSRKKGALEQQIDSLLSAHEFNNQLRSALALQLKKHYETAFSTELNRSNYSDIAKPPLFPESELNKLNQLADNTVARLLNDEDAKEEIREALFQIVSQDEGEEVDVLSPENAANNFLKLLDPYTLLNLGKYQLSSQIIQGTVEDNNTNAQKYAELLNALREECFSPAAKKNIKQTIQTSLENAFSGISELNKTNIANIASRLVDETLNPENALKTLEKTKVNNSSDSNSLIQDTKTSLIQQCDKEIKHIIDTNFADIIIDNILKKINNDEDLSDDEIQIIPLELQYAESKKEFESGLRVNYPHLSSDYESKVNDNVFKTLRLTSRKKALTDINQAIPQDNEIIDLDAEAWLEKKLQLITGKPISLEHIELEKEQKNLLDELSSSLHLSTLYDIAITGKTIPDLTQEIEKASQAQSSAAEQVNQIFQEINKKQAAYPKLIDDEAIAGFRANLNQHLENLSIELKVSEEAAKILLMRINQRLKNDINKWDLFNEKLQKEITNDILTNQNGFAFDETDTEKLVHHAMLVLRNNYPNDTVKKREQWLKDITLLHIFSKKLLAFSQKIEINKTKFLDLKKLKEQDPASQALNEKMSDVWLPKNCSIVASSFDPSFAARQPVDNGFTVDIIFYKQNAPKLNQTLTFSQTLPDKKEQKWSVSRIDDTRLVYQTHKPWFDVIKSIKHTAGKAMTYVRANNDKQFNAEEEVLFTQLTHAVNSSKSKICKITISKNCPKRKERFIRCFIDNHNKNKSDAVPILECQDNDRLKMHKDDKVNMLNKIKTVSNLHDKEMENANKQSNELVNHRIRPRG
jgi:hypothetical protein